MKIGIVSDTHGCAATWRKIYNRYFCDMDVIIHAGDVLYHGPRNVIPDEYDPKALAEELNNCPIPIVAACGNCDAEVDGMVLNIPIQSPYTYLRLENVSVLVNHGHNLSDDAKHALAEKMRVSLFVTGHTHVAALTKQNGCIFLNPGSPAMSKRPDGVGTIARMIGSRIEVLDIESGKVLLAEELG